MAPQVDSKQPTVGQCRHLASQEPPGPHFQSCGGRCRICPWQSRPKASGSSIGTS